MFPWHTANDGFGRQYGFRKGGGLFKRLMHPRGCEPNYILSGVCVEGGRKVRWVEKTRCHRVSPASLFFEPSRLVTHKLFHIMNLPSYFISIKIQS
jgi:hypothetical protein